MVRTIAVDWSGALAGSERKIWFAEARGGVVVRLECGRGRGEMTDHLAAEARRSPGLVVGLDFGFAFPAWYTRSLGCDDAPSLWRRMADGEGDRLLAGCEAPFWGRARSRKPADCELFRGDERALRAAGLPVKSVFQIGGAGAVGTGSLRGMAMLHRLRESGFRIWPFNDATPRAPVAIEIYPRLFTGPVVKSRRDARETHLSACGAAFASDVLREAAAFSEDAFDAATSAIAMSRHAGALGALPVIEDASLRLEGAIWRPAAGAGDGRAAPVSSASGRTAAHR